MEINNILLKKLEKLSSFEIGDDKREEILQQLSDIVSFVNILEELDLDTQKATFTTVKGGTPMREDIPNSNKEIIKSILRNSSHNDEGFFIVPKIIK